GEGFHVGTSKVWRQLREKSNLSGVRIHDLRHTHASTGVALNKSVHIIGNILVQRKPETTSRCSHSQQHPLRPAADHTAQFVSDAMRSEGNKSNVVKLARPK